MEPTPSLERFLTHIGPEWTSCNANRAAGIIQATIGGLLLLLSGCFVVIASNGGQPSFLPAAIGPGVAGAVNLPLGIWMMRKARGKRDQVQLTPEARTLLSSLMSERSQWRQTTNAIVLDPPLRAALDRAASAHNRMQSVRASGGTLPRSAERAFQAIDEGMAAMLHEVALAHRYPEGLAAAEVRWNRQLGAMVEVAERLEAIQAESTAPKVDRALADLEDVLQDLRLEQLANRELNAELERRDVVS